MALALCPPGPEDWQEIHRPSLRKARAAMAVKQIKTTDGDQQVTVVVGNDVTVKHNSSEPRVAVAVQNKGTAQLVTVVVNPTGNEEQKGSKTGDTLSSPPKINE